MKKLLALLLFVSASANAQFTDNFNRTESLDTSANWTDQGASGDALTLDGAVVETEGAESARIAYSGPAQSSPDFYVEADILYAPNSNTNNEALAIRIVDASNYIFLVRNNSSNCIAGIRIANSNTNWLSSSPALCDNATRFRIEAEGGTIRFYIDDGGGMTLYHTESSVTDHAASVLGGFVSTGATGNDAVDVWDNFEMDLLDPVVDPPEFDTEPTLDACTSTACTFDYDGGAVADEIHWMFTDTAAAAPTCAAIEAETGSHGAAGEAVTGAADTATITSIDAQVFPIYDAHFCLEEGTNNYGDVVTVSDNAMLAPTDMQFDLVTSAAALSPCALFNAATAPDIANGDYLRSATTTTPGDYALSIADDCQFEYSGDGSQQSVPDILVYDTSAGDYHADDIDFWDNNNAPVCTDDTVVFVYDEDVLVTASGDLNSFCTDEDGDTLSFSGSLPSGLSLTGDNNELIGGTPDTEDETGEEIELTVTDPADETDTIASIFYIVDTVTVPDYTAGTLAEAEAQHLLIFPWQFEESAISVSFECSNEDENEVIGQDPDASSEITAFEEVHLDVSNGVACGSVDLTGLPLTWTSLANVLADPEFVTLKRGECDADGVWAAWLPGTNPTPRGSANCVVDVDLIEQEADGSAVWARWAPGTDSKNSGNLQIDVRAALTADFVPN